METVRETIHKGCLQLARLRGITYRQALEGHTAQCHAILRDSLKTQEEGYWRRRLETCDRMLAEDSGVVHP